MSGVSLLTTRVAYASTNKTKIDWIETEHVSLTVADAPHVYVRAWTLCCFHSLIRTQTFRRVLTASVIRSACPFSGLTNAGEFGGRCRKWRAECVEVVVDGHYVGSRLTKIFSSDLALHSSGNWGKLASWLASRVTWSFMHCRPGRQTTFSASVWVDELLELENWELMTFE